MQIEVSHLVKEYKRKRDPGSMVKALASMFHPDYERFRAVDDRGTSSCEWNGADESPDES